MTHTKVRSPIYFWDTGLLCHLAGFRSVETLEAGPLGGPVFENLVIAELLKGLLHRGLDLDAYFFRESGGLEADLILQDQEQGWTLVLDFKSSHTAKEAFIPPLERVDNLLAARNPRSPKDIRIGIVYRGESKQDWPRPGCDFLPFDRFIAGYQG